MKFEILVKKISAFVAGVVVYLLIAGIYLSSKGFEMDENGNISLVSAAAAQDNKPVTQTLDSKTNVIFPQKPYLGKEDAPITLYEYSSLGCYHCADFHLNTLPKLQKEFIDTGKVKLVFADFPIDRKSMQAALMAHCMPTEKKYFDFLTLLFKKQREWGLSHNSEKLFKQYALLNGITAEQADACLNDDNEAKEILNIRQQAMDELKLRGTPSFVISAGGKREVLQGAPSYEAFKELLQEKLAAQ